MSTDIEDLYFLRPQSSQLAVYLEAMERLNANIAFKGNSEESAETVSEVGE